MSFKLIIVSVVFASVAWAQFGSNSEQGVNVGAVGGNVGYPNTGPYSFINFLNSLTEAQQNEFLSILGNKASTKRQTTTQVNAWLTKQSSQIQANYKKCKTNEKNSVKEFKAKLDAAAAKNLTAEAKVVYDQIEAIKANQDITKQQENDQIQQLLNNAKPEIKKAIAQIIVDVTMEEINKTLGPLINGNGGIKTPTFNFGK
uniref:DUF148 domain-containing protein n=1 Tax=Rhabditophanes sp. KR3021 TaxID=114890 RepID=A0AC35TPA0_9BILA